MSEPAFQQEYECHFWDDSPEDQFLRECAQAYHERTEAFDKTLTRCLSSSLRASTQHAREVRGELVILCLAKGISPRHLDAAIRTAAQHLAP